jgi:hypothetical protein
MQHYKPTRQMRRREKRRRVRVGCTNIKEYLAREYGLSCVWCNRELHLDKERRDTPGYASKEHVLPQSQMGWGQISNLLLACRECNSRRGSSSLQVFYDLQVARGIQPRLNVLMPVANRLGMSLCPKHGH